MVSETSCGEQIGAVQLKRREHVAGIEVEDPLDDLDAADGAQPNRVAASSWSHVAHERASSTAAVDARLGRAR